jgi:flagellar basal-body rod modification protein FlgD
MTTTTPSATANTNSTASTAQAAGVDAGQQLAGNFDTFLQLLTTQLQNQDPLDPLDTSQFTQQLVEFASVEQQVNTNTNMQTLINLQQTSAATSALQLVGASVTIGGTSATLSNATSAPATWTLNAPSPATAQITVTSATGQTAYTGTMALNAGNNTFSWNGQGNNGVTWPDGSYNIAVTATSASGVPVNVTTQVQGVVSAVNVSATPPTLTVAGQNVPITSVQSISGGALGNLTNLGNSLSSSISSLNTAISNLTQYL